MQLQFTDEQLTQIFGTTAKRSALLYFVNATQTSTDKDKIALSVNWSDAKFHTRGGADKEISDDEFKTFDVPMGDLYKLLTFEDYQLEDEPALVNDVVTNLETIVPNTLDKAIFPGLVPGTPYDFSGVNVKTVDDTAASWIAALQSVADAGYSATGAILDTKLKPLLISALTEGTNVNPLTLSIEDGYNVAGVPVVFRNGLGGKGFIADFSQMAVCFKNGVTAEIHDPKTDWTLRRQNKAGVYAGWRVGVGISDEKAATVISPVVAP